MARWLFEGPITRSMRRPSIYGRKIDPKKLDRQPLRRSGRHDARWRVRAGFAACLAASAASAANAQELTWVGCRGDLMQSGMEALAEAHATAQGISIAVEPGDTTASIRAVAAGAADLGCSGRQKSRSDQERDAKLIPIGWDALVVVVHPSNPVRSVTVADLKRVYAGEITNWRGLGGPDAPIELLVRESATSGIGVMLRKLLFQDPDHGVSGIVVGPEAADSIEGRVQANPLAVAATSVGRARADRLTMLSVDGIQPHYQDIATGKYPLVRPLYLVVAKQASEAVEQFARFIKGAEGQQLVRFSGTVNLADGVKLWGRFRKAVTKPRGG